MKRLNDEYGLFQVVADAIIKFMSIKPEPFLSNALRSQEDFWLVPSWKRGITFVFMLRFTLGLKCQPGWRKFTPADYKLNKRSFDRWMEKEDEVFQASTELYKLPEFMPQTPASLANKKKRKVSVSEFSSTESPMKRSFVVCDESTSDSES